MFQDKTKSNNDKICVEKEDKYIFGKKNWCSVRPQELSPPQ